MNYCSRGRCDTIVDSGLRVGGKRVWLCDDCRADFCGAVGRERRRTPTEFYALLLQFLESGLERDAGTVTVDEFLSR